jgi:hypothetical protein
LLVDLNPCKHVGHFNARHFDQIRENFIVERLRQMANLSLQFDQVFKALDIGRLCHNALSNSRMGGMMHTCSRRHPHVGETVTKDHPYFILGVNHILCPAATCLPTWRASRLAPNHRNSSLRTGLTPLPTAVRDLARERG